MRESERERERGWGGGGSPGREGGRVRGMEQWGLEFKHDQVDGRSPRTRRRRRRSGYEGYCLPPAPSHAGDRRAPPPDKAAAAAEMRQLNHAIRSSVLGISFWHPTVPTSSSSSSSSCSNSVTLCSFVRSRTTQARAGAGSVHWKWTQGNT